MQRTSRQPWSGLAACLPACLLACLLAACSAETAESLLARGKTYSEKKDFKAAITQYKKVLKRDPRATEARYLLGMSLLQLSDPVGAAAELSRALDEKYPTEQVIPPLAQALLLAGDHRKLATLYGGMNLQNPAAQASLMTSVASAWAAMGEYKRAELALAAARKALPAFTPAILLAARWEAGQQDFKAALAELDGLLVQEPAQYEAWQLRGEIEALSGSGPKAGEAEFLKALSIERAYAPAHLALIAMRVRARDLVVAKAQAELMRAALPKHPLMAFVDAQIAYLEKNSVRARELTQQVLRVSPRHMGTLELAGAIEMRDGSLVLADAHYAKALQVDPNSVTARLNLARIAIQLGQFGKAMATLEPLIRADSRDAQALSLAGEVQLRLNRAALAEGYFVRAARIVPADSRVQTALALTQLERGDAAVAFNSLERVAAASKDSFADQAIVNARLKRREFDLALRALEAMSAKAPLDAATHELRGRVQLARKDLPAARTAFEQALAADPSLFAATAALANIELLDKKPELALRRLQKSVLAEPRNHHARLALAEMRLRTGAPVAEVKRLLAESIQLAPAQSAPWLRLIDLNLRDKQFADALAVAHDATAALPNDLNILDAVGRAYRESGEAEQAIAAYRRLAGVNPDSALPYLRMADIYSATQRPAQAEEVLRRAIEVEPGLVSAQTALIDLMLKAGRTRELLEMATGMQARRPKEPSGYLLEAAAHRGSEARDAAAAALRRGLVATQGRTELAQTLVQLLMVTQRAAEADSFAAAWLKSHPQDAAFEYVLAMSAIAKGNLDQAEMRLTRVVAAQGRHVLALNNLAWVLAKRGKPGAVALAEQAVALNPDNAPLLDTLALALAAQGEFDRAVETQRRAIELAPADPSLRLGLARIAVSANNKSLARAELQNLQSLGATFAGQAEVTRLLNSL